MKYGNITKTARNNAIKEYLIAHPDLSLKEIGDVFGISKQRVHQILAKTKKQPTPVNPDIPQKTISTEKKL